MWSALALLPLLLGSSTTIPQNDICAQEGPALRTIIADNEVHVPPEVKILLLDTTDGKQDKVIADVQRMQLKFNAAEMTKWLNQDLFRATYYNRATIADWLIGQGADVNAHTVNIALAGSPNPTEDDKMWPPLEQAADCGNTAVLKVLLAHHADMYTSLHEPHPEPGALLLAIVGRHNDTVEVLLDHGYDPCLFDANYHHSSQPHLTAAGLAKRRGLSASVVQRLTKLSASCTAPSSARPTGSQ